VETNVRTPMQVFMLPQRLVVPLFQRAYRWTEDDQWLPLWQDVRRMAELRLSDPHASARHFLGAVVVQAQGSAVGSVSVRNVIDGQQRLTTLQLLMDAAGSVFEEQGLDVLAAQMDALTHNQRDFVPDEDERLKLRPTDKDAGAFDEVMRADPPVDHARLKHASSLVVKAHAFFVAEARSWLTGAGDDDARARAGALASVLSSGLQLVVIDLRDDEDSHEIFETLNARGTPLTAADLIKNYVFAALAGERGDVQKAHAAAWRFDGEFWEKDVSVGRYVTSRSSLFFTQWLGSRVGEEVSPKSTFTRFRYYVEHEAGLAMSELLPRIAQQADLYERWTKAADEPYRELGRAETAVYRMKATGVELLKPILLWLHEPGREIATDVADRVLAMVESWMVRRQLLRLPSADLGRVVADLVRVHRAIPDDDLVARVQGYLTGLKVVSTYWPGDAEVRAGLRTAVAYRRFPRGRLRMYLEAVEDHSRQQYRYGPLPRLGYPIEHLLPQRWRSTWPVEGLEAEIDRDAHVHRIGNLTLLTTSLNTTVSNGPWLGPKGKLAMLGKHDVLLMNRRIAEAGADGWDEARIDQRTDEVIDALLAIWPVPVGHEGAVVDQQSGETPEVELRHLVAAGLMAPGTVLTARPGAWGDAAATVTTDGHLEIGGVSFGTPSAAGRHVRGGGTNGWAFWQLEDGRRLADVRDVYRQAGFGSPEAG
jgi:hypothetical protein